MTAAVYGSAAVTFLKCNKTLPVSDRGGGGGVGGGRGGGGLDYIAHGLVRSSNTAGSSIPRANSLINWQCTLKKINKGG